MEEEAADPEEEATEAKGAEKEAEKEAAEAIDPTDEARNARDTDPTASRSKEMVHATTLPTLASEHRIEQIWRLS